MDRLRAKPPAEDGWKKGVLDRAEQDKGKAFLKDGTELVLTSELVKLFESRVEGVFQGCEVWYIKKE